jgi:hypothetical protein
MSQNPSAQQIEKAIKILVSEVEPAYKKISELLEKNVNSINAIESLAEAYEDITGKRPPNLPADIERVLFATIHPSSKIGDAVYSILKTSPAPLDKNDIIERLRAANIRISLKSPRTVLNTAIKTDKQKRFEVLDDGRVDLVYPNTEKAIRRLRHAE